MLTVHAKDNPRCSEFVLQQYDRDINIPTYCCSNRCESYFGISASQYTGQLIKRTFRWRGATLIASRDERHFCAEFSIWHGAPFISLAGAIRREPARHEYRSENWSWNLISTSSVSNSVDGYVKQDVVPIITFHLFEILDEKNLGRINEGSILHELQFLTTSILISRKLSSSGTHPIREREGNLSRPSCKTLLSSACWFDIWITRTAKPGDANKNRIENR